MKFDSLEQPPKKEKNGNKEILPKENFEKVKNKFTVESENYIKKLSTINRHNNSSLDKVIKKIEELANDEEEKHELSKIFLNLLITFLNKLDPEESFHTDMTIKVNHLIDEAINNLNYNLLDKISIVSKFNETLIHTSICELFYTGAAKENIPCAGLPGKIEKDILSSSQEKLNKLTTEITKKPISEILSITEMFLLFARDKDSNISKKAQYIIDKIKNNVKSPILSFTSNIDESTIENIRESIENETTDSSLYYEYDERVSVSSVSSDYVSIMDEFTLIPFAIAKKDEASSEKKYGERYETKSYEELTKEKELNPLGNEDFSHLIKFLHTPKTRWYINEQLGIKVESLALREQIYFLKFLSTSNKETFNKLEKILKNKNETENNNFLRSFLSMSGNEEMGNKILELREKLPENVAKKVFAKYEEIIDNINNITDFAKNNFIKEIETNPETIRKTEETLYKKGQQLLSQTYDDIKEEKNIDFSLLGRQLDRINADTITTLAIFRQALKNGEKLPIESIEGSVFSKKEATDMSINQQNEMLELYESNWKNHPDRNFVESLKLYFKTAFNPENNKLKNYFYLFEKDMQTNGQEKHIRAFVRFEKIGKQNLYASALNVDEASKNFGLGEAMMDEALSREAKENILHASCRKDNPSNMRYFEKGFISRGFKKTNETEEFDLVWDEEKNKNILAKQKSQVELIDVHKKGEKGELEIKKRKELLELHKDIPEEKALVRCFLNNGEWYAVYEKVLDNYGLNSEETA